MNNVIDILPMSKARGFTPCLENEVCHKDLAAPRGLEPRSREPKSLVLPLDDGAFLLDVIQSCKRQMSQKKGDDLNVRT